MSTPNSTILAADVGGTHVRFGCLERHSETLPCKHANKAQSHATVGPWHIRNFIKRKVENYPTFDAALKHYIDSLQTKPALAALCAAGPIEKGCVTLTNSHWHISTKRTAEIFQFDLCEIYNDFAGMTRSIPELDDDQFTSIRTGMADPHAPILVAGAGTGFGVGYLLPVGSLWRVIATEGGHMAYSPQSNLELQLTQILRRDHEFVSVERVSSGAGLAAVHKAVCEIHGVAYAELNPEDIHTRAHNGDRICQDVCIIRANAAMGAIGDLALSGGARGGIVLAGGVSERMIDFYTQPHAINRFLNRGPRSEYVRNIPIRLLKSPLAPLIGAAALMKEKF